MALKTTQDGLNDRQKLFVIEYLKDLSPTEAYIRAGYNPRGAAQNAHRLMKNDKIKMAIEQTNTRILNLKEGEITQLLSAVRLAAYSTADDILDFDGEEWKLKPANKVSVAARSTITDVEVIETTIRGKTTRRIKIKRQSKDAAQERLLRHYGLLVDRLDVTSGGKSLVPEFIEVPVDGETIEHKQEPADNSIGLADDTAPDVLEEERTG
jgi:phage terminase small subunit